MSLTTFWHSTLEPNFTYDLLSLTNISTNSQPIATKVCQRMEALKCILFMQRNDFLKIVTYDLYFSWDKIFLPVFLTFGPLYDYSMTPFHTNNDQYCCYSTLLKEENYCNKNREANFYKFLNKLIIGLSSQNGKCYCFVICGLHQIWAGHFPFLFRSYLFLETTSGLFHYI